MEIKQLQGDAIADGINRRIEDIRSRWPSKDLSQASIDIEWLLGYCRILEMNIRQATADLRAMNLSLQQIITTLKSKGF